jgi:FKBP-type peptidyl-prolyl cis-trans isomerase FkpA
MMKKITMLALGGIMIGNLTFADAKHPNTVENKSTTTEIKKMTTDSKTIKTASGLQYEVVKAGTGATCSTGQKIKVHYTGTLENGNKFDCSRDRGEPIEFTLGVGQVIKGWDEGVNGMKIGEQRKLTIPANLAYGDRAIGTIPAKSTLLFDVELVDIAA